MMQIWTIFSAALFLLASCAHSAPIRIPTQSIYRRENGTTGSNETSSSSVPAPRFVVYDDALDGTSEPPSADQLKGYNVYALSFYTTDGAQDKAQSWASLSASRRSEIKSSYKAANIKMIVSLFGSENMPTKQDPDSIAEDVTQWVKQYDLDGVDVDYEDDNAFNTGSGAETWLISFTKALRSKLPAGSILTHAPQAPWFSTDGSWPGGGYMKVHQEVGSDIDWYNVQFYNQGETAYTSCETLLNKADYSGTSVFEIIKAGVPADKVVIGKPATSQSASNGFVSTTDLAKCVSQAKGKGWNGGVMVWEWPDANAQWIETVRGQAFPEDSSSSRRRSTDQVRRRVAARSIARRRAKEEALQRRRERRRLSQEDQ